MKQITIDCGKIESRDALHKAFAEALDFPGWYGHNLDALHDCLTDVHEEIVLQLLHWKTAEEALGNYACAARRVLEDAVRENPSLILEFP